MPCKFLINAVQYVGRALRIYKDGSFCVDDKRYSADQSGNVAGGQIFSGDMVGGRTFSKGQPELVLELKILEGTLELLFCEGNVTTHAETTIKGAIQAEGNVSVGGNVGGDVQADGNVTVHGDVGQPERLGGSVSAEGNVSIGGNVASYVEAEGNVVVKGNVGGQIQADGNVIVGSR